MFLVKTSGCLRPELNYNEETGTKARRGPSLMKRRILTQESAHIAFDSANFSGLPDMPVYYHHLTFFGRVFPSGTHLTVTDAPEVTYVDPETYFYSVRMRIKFVDTAIEITCDFDRLFEGYLGQLYIQALNYAQTIVNLAAFQTGTGAIVVLDSWADQFGKTEMHLFEPNAANICSAYNFTTGLQEIFNLMFAEPAIFMALNDLVLAVSMPGHTLINCARSVEAIRQMIAGQFADDRKVQWPIMRKALNIDHAYISLITEKSTAPRHGNQTPIRGTVLGEVIKRSWTIMDRFFHFRRNGNENLPLDRFPLLTG